MYDPRSEQSAYAGRDVQQAMCQPMPGPPQLRSADVSDVHAWLTRLNDGLQRLENLTHRLDDKLSVVLCPSPADNCKEGPHCVPRCELSTHIAGHAEHLNRLNNAIEDILDRIQL